MTRYSASQEAWKMVCSLWNLLFVGFIATIFFYFLPGEPAKESVKMIFVLLAGLLEFPFFYWYAQKNDPTFKYMIKRY